MEEDKYTDGAAVGGSKSAAAASKVAGAPISLELEWLVTCCLTWAQMARNLLSLSQEELQKLEVVDEVLLQFKKEQVAPKPRTQNPNPKKPKPETQNPKPKTQNPKF